MSRDATNASGKRMAILAADGFEESELFSPREAIEKAGGTVEVISLKTGEIQGMRHMEPGRKAQVNRTVKDAKPEDYDAILIPGGLFSPDQLRTDHDALKFAGSFLAHRKPVFAICHGPQVLISAGMVAGRTMTAVKAVQTDLENAGAKVKDQAVVDDHGLVTSRTPDDLDAFNAAIVKEISRDSADRHEGHHKWAMI
jgi:protease I